MRKISFVLCLVFSANIFAFNFDINEIKNYLTGIGKVESTYHYICDKKYAGTLDIEDNWSDICKVVKKSEFCSHVKPIEQLKCTKNGLYENEVDYSSFGFVFRCLFGAGKSIVNFLNLVKDILESTILYTFDSEFRELKNSEISDMVESITSYIALEYAKEIDNGSSSAVAMARVGGSLISKIFGTLVADLKDKIQDLGCYNQKQRQIKVCEKIGDVLLPTAAALKLVAKSVDLLGKLKDKTGKPFTKRNLRGATGKQYDDTVKLDPYYKGEDYDYVFATNVKYLKQAQRDKMEVFVGKDGLLRDVNGEIIDTTDAVSFKGDEKRAIFVMNPDGRIFFSDAQAVGKFHHSSFNAGADVASAGEMIVEQGRVVYVNRRSGHYKPSEVHLRQFVDELNDRGANIEELKVDFDDKLGD